MHVSFLGLECTYHGSQSIKSQSKVALNTYGCDSCGPCGFYRAIDMYFQLEESMTNLLKTNAAILYSDAASVSTSAMAAFAKCSDSLIVDESIYKPLCTSIKLSHATVEQFCHNDMDYLEN
eukprot:9572630-Ditylum_brightwellii.AAC.1